MAAAPPTAIGRITRCSIVGFVGASQLPEESFPAFADFCKAPLGRGSRAQSTSRQSHAVGLIYDINVPDDELARQVAAAEDPSAEQLADNQLRRAIPLEILVLTIGHQEAGVWAPGLPAQPPRSLAPIWLLSDEEIRAATEDLDFVRLVLAASGPLPVEDLLRTGLRRAALARPASRRTEYLVRAGRECARILGHDLARLETLLRSLPRA